MSFIAVARDNNRVELDWITSLEIKNDYFTIEKSHDENEWEKVLTVDGAGNSTNLLLYSAVDYNPFEGISYYRLKQTDYEGESSYSDAVTVVSEAIYETRIYPNPADGHYYN